MKARRPSTRPVAVIFDMDGLMLDTESLGPQTWRDAAAAIGVDFDLGLLPSMIGRNYRDCREMLREHYGPSYPVEQLTATCLTVFDAIVARDGIAQKPGLRELLDWLERRTSCARSRRPRAATAPRRNSTQQGLLQRFAALVGGNEVERGKPEPDIFLLAASRLSVAPADCVVLEDSEPGVRAALAAGMMPIMVPDLHAPSPGPARARAAGAAVAARRARASGAASTLISARVRLSSQGPVPRQCPEVANAGLRVPGASALVKTRLRLPRHPRRPARPTGTGAALAPAIATRCESATGATRAGRADPANGRICRRRRGACGAQWVVVC